MTDKQKEELEKILKDYPQHGYDDSDLYSWSEWAMWNLDDNLKMVNKYSDKGKKPDREYYEKCMRVLTLFNPIMSTPLFKALQEEEHELP